MAGAYITFLDPSTFIIYLILDTVDNSRAVALFLTHAKVIGMTLNRLVVGFGAFGASSLAWGQDPPPDITWGPLAQSVPLSPVLTALIAIMLLGASYAFMKRHSGTGFGVLVMASLLGIAGVNEDVFAPIDTFNIPTSSGRASPCQDYEVDSLLVRTSVDPGVIILSANQQPPVPSKGQEDTKLNVIGTPICAAGNTLLKDKLCLLLCSFR